MTEQTMNEAAKRAKHGPKQEDVLQLEAAEVGEARGEVGEGAGDGAAQRGEADHAVARGVVAAVEGEGEGREARDEGHPPGEAQGDWVHWRGGWWCGGGGGGCVVVAVAFVVVVVAVVKERMRGGEEGLEVEG